MRMPASSSIPMPAGVAERSGADLGNCGSERRAKPVPCSISLQLDDPRTSLGWVDPPVLIGAGVVLRPLDEADAPRIVHCLLRPANPAVAGVVAVAVRAGGGEGLPEATRETAAQRTGLNWCVADRSSGVCLGSISLIGFGGHSRRAEIGYWAHPGARGAGVTTAAVRLVTQARRSQPAGRLHRHSVRRRQLRLSAPGRGGRLSDCGGVAGVGAAG